MVVTGDWVISGKNEAGHKWVKAFGIPLHGWTRNTFCYLGDLCGGFARIDEDTKHRSNLYWARIRVHRENVDPLKELDLLIDDLKYKVSILEDQITKIIQDADRIAGVEKKEDGGDRAEGCAGGGFFKQLEDDRGKPIV